jgi:hypothetical protein
VAVQLTAGPLREPALAGRLEQVPVQLQAHQQVPLAEQVLAGRVAALEPSSGKRVEDVSFFTCSAGGCLENQSTANLRRSTQTATRRTGRVDQLKRE